MKAKNKTKTKTSKKKTKTKVKTSKKKTETVKPKPLIRFTIDKSLARALSLTKGGPNSHYMEQSLDVARVTEKGEIITTNRCSLLVVTPIKDNRLLLSNIQQGLYDIVGDTFLKIDKEEFIFPDCVQFISTKPKLLGTSIISLLSDILTYMIKSQTKINIWRFENVLKILNKYNSWTFYGDSPHTHILMECETFQYNIKYVVMPVSMK